jgi:hypothetical protein
MHQFLAKNRQGNTEWFAVDLASVEKAYEVAAQQRGRLSYFWTAKQREKHEEEMEERRAEYYEQYPWEDPEYEWPD